MPAVTARMSTGYREAGEVYPGWCGRVGYRRVLYRVLTQPSAEALFEAYLMNYI